METRVFIPSGAGAPGFGGIFQCLSEMPGITVYAGDMNEYAYGRYLATGFKKMPSADSADYLSSVISAAQEFHCNVLLPITTRDLVLFSQNLEMLKAEGLATAISEATSMKTANNKFLLYEFLEKHNLPHAKYVRVSDRLELLNAIYALGYPAKRIVMKPSEGNGSRGFRIVTGIPDIQKEYFQSKYGSIYTSIESVKLEMPEYFPMEMLVCEYLPGVEYSVDIIADQGNVVCQVVRSRDKTVSGISVAGTFLHHPEIESVCSTLVRLLQLHGPLGIQLKQDEKGAPKIIEINPRLQGAVSAANLIGLNFPLMAVELALGKHVQQVQPTFENGVKFNRYWTDIPLK